MNAAIYPFQLCKAVLRRCQRQLYEDGLMLLGQTPAEAWARAVQRKGATSRLGWDAGIKGRLLPLHSLCCFASKERGNPHQIPGPSGASLQSILEVALV